MANDEEGIQLEPLLGTDNANRPSHEYSDSSSCRADGSSTGNDLSTGKIVEPRLINIYVQ